MNRSAWVLPFVLPVLLIVELFRAAAGASAQGGRIAAQQPLAIYVIDTEGGKAALRIAPSGQTVLIDSGSPGARDLDRLMEVAAAAGMTRIDYLISTHYRKHWALC